jgi:hypothetical protein
MQFRSVAKLASMHTAGIADAVTFVAGSRLLDATDQCFRIGFDLGQQNARGNRGQYEPGSELPADCLSTEQATHSRFHARRSITESRPVLRASSECILAHHG